MTENILYSNFGSIFVYPKGENRLGYYSGCVDADAIAEPQGDLSLIRCFDVFGKSKTVGSTQAPPDPVTTTLTSLSYTTRNWLERIRGKFGLVMLQHDGGRVDTVSDWNRALVLGTCRVTSRTFDNIVKREDQAGSTTALDISSEPPLLDCAKIAGRNVYHITTHAVFGLHFLKEPDGFPPMLFGVAGTLAEAGAHKADVLYTVNGGETWIVCSGQPFADTEPIFAVAILDMGEGNHRFLAFTWGIGTQGKVAYSDNDGSTWTTVNIGGAAAGHGPVAQSALHVMDQHHIWITSRGGYVYFSSDAGVTWTAQVSGTVGGVTVSDQNAISFDESGMLGMSVGDYVVGENQVIHTMNGGVTWSTGNIIGGRASLWEPITGTPDFTAVCVIDEDHVWIGTLDGQVEGSYSRYQGMHKRSFIAPPSGLNKVSQIVFLNNWVGFFIMMGAAAGIYQTIDGGMNWVVRPDQASTGLTAVAMALGDQNYLSVCGAYLNEGLIHIYDESAVG